FRASCLLRRFAGLAITVNVTPPWNLSSAIGWQLPRVRWGRPTPSSRRARREHERERLSLHHARAELHRVRVREGLEALRTAGARIAVVDAVHVLQQVARGP